MSIYNIMAFNAAHDQVAQNTKDSQNIAAKKVETQTAQETLDLNKQLDKAKISQAQNEGTMNDYIRKQLTQHINDSYKAKQDQLDAVSGLQDIAQHKAQTAAAQGTQVADHLLANDPDVQAHAQTMMGVMGTRQSAPADVNPAAGGESQQSQMSVAPQAQAPQLPSIPGIAPAQGGASPQNVQSQVAAPIGASAPQTSSPEAMPQAAQQAPQGAAAAPSAPQPQQGGIDLSPVEQAFGMPKGSMWLNLGTMKPEVNPIWKSKIEKEQAAQATYDVNQPFREVQRQDKLETRATQLITKAIQNRSGGIGLQDNKVNAAIHARELVNQAYNPQTGEYDVTQVPYGELAESLGSLLSGGTGSSEGRINSLKQRTAQGDLNGALSYISGKPSNATSQDALKQLVQMIDRQGQVSEDLRDKYLEGIKKLPVFNELDPDRAQALIDTNLGNSFKDHLKNAPDIQATKNVFSNEAEAEKANLPPGTIVTINGRRAKVQ